MLVFDLANPRRLVGEARGTVEGLDASRFTLSRWLPRQTDRTIRYEIQRNDPLVGEAATYRAFDVESAIGRRGGVTRAEGRMLPISRKMVLTEGEQYVLEGIDDARVRQHYQDARQTAYAIAARLELARGQVLSTGSLVLNERGAIATVQFGIPAEHRVVAPIAWSDTATSDPIFDLASTWLPVYRAGNNGRNPGAILTSTRVAGFLMRNASIVDLATQGRGPGYISLGDVNRILGDFALPPIAIYDEEIETDLGVTQRVIADDLLLMLPPPGPESVDVGNSDVNRAGETLYGVTLEGRTLANRQVLEENEVPGIVSVMHQTESPIQRETESVALAFPILRNPHRILIADVL